MESNKQTHLCSYLKYPCNLVKSCGLNNRYGIAIACGAGALLVTNVISNVFYPLFVPVFLKKVKRNLGYLCKPLDVLALLIFKFTAKLPTPPIIDANWDWAYDMLAQNSRSFVAVILELDKELRESICAFYLVLRALDSIEDDMAPKVEDKIRELRSFHEHLTEDGWNLKGYGEKQREIELLEHFDRLISAMKTLDEKHQAIIADICKRMGHGMAEFLEKKVVTVEDWELYCHYVAGLVGYGLTALFGSSGLEPQFASQNLDVLSNSMGLFLQKTNITRDILEDSLETPPRLFWPEEVVKQYVPDVFSLFEWKNRHKALYTLNHLITSALSHTSDVLDYLSLLTNESVFKFCAIPQVMAIATLDLCYNNYDVYQYEVKIRKGEAVRLILGTKDYRSVCTYFLKYAYSIKSKIPRGDPNKETLEKYLNTLIDKCQLALKN